MRTLAAAASALVAVALVPAAQAAVPVNTIMPHTTGSPVVGATVWTTVGTWSSATPIAGYDIEWIRCVPSGTGGCRPNTIAGETATTYVLQGADVGATVYPAIRARNADGTSSPESGFGIENITATATGPIATAPPHVTGEAVAGTTLSASTGSWSAAPSSFTYQWWRCYRVEDGCIREPIEDATSPTHTFTGGSSLVWVTVSADGSAPVASDNLIGSTGGGLGGEDDYYGDEEGDYGDGEGEYGDEVDDTSRPGTTLAKPTVRNTGWAASTRRVGAKIVVKPAIRVVCPARVPSCSIELVAKVKLRTGRTVTVARSTRTVRASSRTAVSFTLNAAGRRLLGQRRQLTARVTVVARTADGDPVTLTKKIPIRRPAGPR